jgi:hypothetical protein
MIVIGYAILIAILLFVLDRYLDMRVVSYTADAQRHANNLLHMLLNSEKITKEKLIVNKDELEDYNEKNWFLPLMSDERKTWEEDNEILEYDYNFSITEFGKSVEKHQFGNLIFDMESQCYHEYQRIKGYSEMPISVYDEDYDEYIPGIAILTLMKTPLAELSFWISQSALRLEKGYDDEILKSIRLGNEVSSIILKKEDDKGLVCMNVRDKWACKHFYPGSFTIRVCYADEETPKEYIPKSCEVLSGERQYNLMRGCKAINMNATINGIDVIIPVR